MKVGITVVLKLRTDSLPTALRASFDGHSVAKPNPKPLADGTINLTLGPMTLGKHLLTVDVDYHDGARQTWDGDLSVNADGTFEWDCRGGVVG
jgi:hypothetical protein